MKKSEVAISKILKFPPASGFGKYRKIFPSEAVSHPAKMSTELLEYLVLKYTEEGDLVLDCMAGTGSTGVLCVLNGRNCIQVELERRFFEWMEQARKKVEKTQTLTQKGKIINILGDARNLSSLLDDQKDRLDSVLFSPPFANRFSDKLLPNDERRGRLHYARAGAKDTRNIGFLTYKDEEIYNNIDNSDISFVDHCLFSPPFGDCVSDTKTEEEIRKRKVDLMKKYSTVAQKNPGGCFVYEWRYSDNKNNIGNLHFKRRSNPRKNGTYLQAMYRVYLECYKVLKPSGRLILVLKNFIRDKKLVLLTEHTIKLCEGVGFVLKERLLYKLPAQSFWRILYRKKYPDVDTMDLNYEHILIFEKTAEIDANENA